MIKFLPTDLQDVAAFDPEEEIPTLFQDMEWCIGADHIDILTMFNEQGGVVCLCGLVHIRPGVAEAFIIRSKIIKNHKLDFYKAVRWFLDRCFLKEGYNLHRVQLAIDCSWIEGAKWATSIGFKFEGIAKDYILKKDHAIYARIKKWQQAQ